MKIFLDSVGCRLNQSEIEKMGMQFREAGHDLVPTAAEADLVVINTCAVTAAASSDSRQKIRAAARSGHARIVATGCYATIDPKTLSNLASVEQVISNQEKDELAGRFAGGAENDFIIASTRLPLPGKRKRTRAFIKVQDGCENHCTFCITRIARGASRSVEAKEIFRDVERALSSGVKEIVLTGVNLGSWGRETGSSGSLETLISEITARFHPTRMRLSSLEPWDVDEGILRSLSLPGFCQHLHLPLQSGSDDVLRRMARRITCEKFEQTIKRIREASPQIAITTDVMVGFPGESEAHFFESLAFVRRMRFSGGHVFSYSLRPGTPAEQMPNRLEPKVIKERSRLMRNAIEESAADYRLKFLGLMRETLWEKAEQKGKDWVVEGLTDNYISVQAISNKDLYNQISRVKFFDLVKTTLLGEILTE
jgi:threonylcarbamoyladenosine tRNA methylthiotransferase MtaB